MSRRAPRAGMSAWPEAAEVRRFLSRVTRRIGWIAAGRGAAAGLLIAAGITVFTGPAGAVGRAALPGVLLASACAAVWWAVARGVLPPAPATARTRRRAAYRVERGAPDCRNLLITAEELIERPERVRPWVAAAVCREAALVADRLEPAALFPARGTIAAVLAAGLLWSASIVRASALPTGAAGALPNAGDVETARIAGIDVTITPPEYAGGAPTTVRDPARVEALAGSRVGVTVRGEASSAALETLAGTRPLAADGAGAFTGEIIAESDGYIAIDAQAARGPGERRLIGLTVREDRVPSVRVTAPGRDLFLADASGAVDIEVEADDDIGLASLRLRYTKVTGSGEQYTFADGELPLTLARRGDREWTGSATLRLNALQLGAGDVLVYRGVASDERPGSAAVESDAFIVEITAPGHIAAEGFAMDDEHGRYAISQQMVILQTERLIARAGSMPADSVQRVARTLAAEQRTVRAEFVFMMGGELAEEVEAANIGDLNEEDHVAADDEAIAGRLENQGRFALIRAIRAMSRAYAALNEARLDSALVEEKAALEHLQRAFSRTRYILRALTERERIDLERRLSGDRSDARSSVQPPFESTPDARSAALLDALAGIATIGAMPEPGPADATRATRLAEAVLRADPSAPSHQQVAGRLIAAAAGLAAGQDVRELLDRVATELAALVGAGLPRGPDAPRPLELDRLDGALADRLRAEGR